MSLTEKVKAAVGVTPSHTDAEREDVRTEARKNASTEWFKTIIKHHIEIEAAFKAVKIAQSADARGLAEEKLATIITGHAVAEEAIVYPFMKLDTSAMDASHVYTEHSIVKMELVALNQIADKLSKEYDDELEKIREAVAHHMIEEERDFYPELQSKAEGNENTKISQRYNLEFERYMPSQSAA